MKRNMKILATSLLLAFTPLAGAQAAAEVDTQVSVLDRVGSNRGSALVAAKIAGNFTSLAGSEENALALVNALRTGETVQLTYAPTGTQTAPTIGTIDPPTGQMGWGNVKISLALAQDQLARLGITNPTAEQLQAALNGGDVIVTNADGTTTTTTLGGVLQMRADGMGWGNIAKAGGTKLGPVVSQLKMANTQVAAIPPTTTAQAAAAVKARGLTTAVGTPATGKSKGLTTAAGGGELSGSRNGTRGLTTAGGVVNTHSARGITTAQGAVTASHGSGQGRGLVTASGANPTTTATLGGGRASGAGLVTGAGGGASGMTTAHGNAGGNGKGQGGGKGNGRGGG